MNTFNNHFDATGRVGQKPEFKSGEEAGDSWVRFSIATNDNHYIDDKGHHQDEVSWHSCVSFGRIAERIIKKVEEGAFDKGSLVRCEGQYKNNNYTDKEGNERRRMQFHVSRYRIIYQPE